MKHVVTIQSVGATAFAVAATEEGKRKMVRHAESGPRFVAGDRILVDSGHLSGAILENWEWEDPQRAKAAAAVRSQKLEAEREEAAAYREEIQRAIDLATPPAMVDAWEETLRACHAAIPAQRPGFGAVRIDDEKEALAQALANFIRWAEGAGADMNAVDAVFNELFPYGVVLQRSIEGIVPPPDHMKKVKELWETHTSLPTERVQQLIDDRRLRRFFDWLSISFEAMWIEDTDIGDMLDLPPGRYFVVASHIEDPIYQAFDLDTSKLMEITTLDGEYEPQLSFKTIDDILIDRYETMMEVFEDPRPDEREALDVLGEWLGIEWK